MGLWPTPGTPAQQTILIALTQAPEIAKGIFTNIFMDIWYDFAMADIYKLIY